MLKWLRRRRELIAAEADEFMAAYRNEAYFKARAEARVARNKGDLYCSRMLTDRVATQNIHFGIVLFANK